MALARSCIYLLGRDEDKHSAKLIGTALLCDEFASQRNCRTQSDYKHRPARSKPDIIPIVVASMLRRQNAVCYKG